MQVKIVPTTELQAGDIVDSNGVLFRLLTKEDISDRPEYASEGVAKPVLSFTTEFVELRYEDTPEKPIMLHASLHADWRVTGNVDSEWEVVTLLA